MTPRTPGLDPERVRAAFDSVAGMFLDPSREGFTPKLIEFVLAADDAHARSRGLVATGDALTREALAGLVAALRLFTGPVETPGHDVGCEPEYVDDPGGCSSVCPVPAAHEALAALPSSLLDETPEVPDA